MAAHRNHLAAYDIRSDRRRRRVLRVMLGHAAGRQKSVFECRMSRNDLPLLLEQAGNLIDPETDRFLILPCAGLHRLDGLGLGRGASFPAWHLVN